MTNKDKQFIYDLFAIDSPSGFTKQARQFLINELEKRPLAKHNITYHVANNESLIINVPGQSDYTVAVSAHVDTLGAMVRSINNDGTLRFEVIGGPILGTYNGEYCKVHTRDGKVYQGTILSNSPAVHVYKDARTIEPIPEHMHVRLDEVTSSKAETKKLGIRTGDFIAIDPKTVIFDNGFIKSRFLDDKICVYIAFKLLDWIIDNPLNFNVTFIITAHEEIGIGNSYMPHADELIALDMGCIGLDLNGNEQSVSICVKDAGGTYNYELTSQLISLAEQHKVSHAVDIYPFYSSDATAAIRAGHNIKAVLIGPGVHASHGMERTHVKALNATLDLLKLYLTNHQ